MKEATRSALNAMNRAFYDARGAAFDASRDHPWPGWSRALAGAGASEPDRSGPRRVLDLGCGNGRFGAWLMQRDALPTRYLGIDASEPLLDRARATLRASPRHFDVELQRLDFLEAAGLEALPGGPFELIVLFGVLHHVPGAALRRRLVVALAERLAPGGRLVLTAWQFGDKARFERSLLSDEEVRARSPRWGLEADDLEPGDHFLGFAGDESVPRYCHALGADELDTLCDATGLQLVDAFLADGKSGDLNAYRVLDRPAR